MQEEAISQTAEADFLFGRLKQLQMRYPRLIGDVRHGNLVVDVEFYLEDVAMDATHTLLDAGITAIHRMNSPKVMSLQLPSLIDQQQELLVIDLLDRFLRGGTGGSVRAKSSGWERR
jgi:4-aminobutyrate aminotransferase-like enzyme